jgi:putative glutamine amidotransferase
MSSIKVACATAPMAGLFDRWFKNVTIIGSEDKFPANLDLLILTGGNDINPDRYRERPNGAIGWDNERDEAEMSILGRAIRAFPGVKILGVCRGMQLLNVFFGGALHQDLVTEGLGHGGVHPISFRVEDHPLSWLKVVNSMHHQGLRYFGYEEAINYIAEEPTSGIPEIVVWKNKYLGVQFHPEMFSDTLGKRFFSQITDWVSGKLDFGSEFDSEDEEEELEEMEEELEEMEETEELEIDINHQEALALADDIDNRLNQLRVRMRREVPIEPMPAVPQRIVPAQGTTTVSANTTLSDWNVFNTSTGTFVTDGTGNPIRLVERPGGNP